MRAFYDLVPMRALIVFMFLLSLLTTLIATG